MALGRPPLDLAGRQCGDWTVLKRCGSNAHGHALWLCRCRCGRKRKIIASRLAGGHTGHCQGCAMRRRWASGLMDAVVERWRGRPGRQVSRGADDPTPEEIEAMCREIRGGRPR